MIKGTMVIDIKGENMLENIFEIALYLIIISIGIMTSSSLLFDEDSKLTRFMAACSGLIPFIVFGRLFTEKAFSTYFFSGLIIVYISILLLNSNSIKHVFWFSLGFGMVIPFIPLELNDSVITLNQLLISIALFFNMILLLKCRKDKQRGQLSIYILLLLASIASYFFNDYILSITFALLFSLFTWFSISDAIMVRNKHIKSLEKKLEVLENEFNDELRKAVNRHTFHLKEVQEKMSHINKIDGLTKAFNKKAIFNIIDELTTDNKSDIFSIIMFDIDYFKKLNDTLGHVTGDMCLKTLAKIALDSIRDTDYLGRYGGDEFLIVLPKAKLSTAITIAERFRKNIDEQTKPHFTISVGLATYPDDGRNTKNLLAIADTGLYLSKEKGRNSVSYHNPELKKKF